MKIIKLIILLLLISTISYTQQTAFFESTIYIEDALGHRDSVVLGSDPDANGHFNPNFGEVDINTPWDSVLEIRASHSVADGFAEFPDESFVLSKKIIGRTSPSGIDEDNNCIPFKEVLLMFTSAKYYPLTLSWNRSDYDNVCSSGAFIAAHQTALIVDFWFFDPASLATSACMQDTGQHVINTFDEPVLHWWIMDEKEGIGLDSIHGLLIAFDNASSPYTPCNRDLVSTSTPSEPVDFTVLPNPASDKLYLQSEELLNWELFTPSGALLKTGNAEAIAIDDYPDGIYFLRVRAREGGLPSVRKIVKMAR